MAANQEVKYTPGRKRTPKNPRAKGICPSCGREITIKKGVGPYSDGAGDVMEHRKDGYYCHGGKAIAKTEARS